MRMKWADILIPAAAALLLHAGLLAVVVARNHGDVSILVGAGSDQVGAAPYEAVTTAVGPSGADGMWYYVIARWPARRHVGMDFPANRHLRIAYPLLCWFVSGGPWFAGQAWALLWVMPALNLLAIAALAGLGAWLARSQGASGWWGFVLPLAVNAAIPALRNLTDCLSTLAILGLLTAWLYRCSPLALAVWTLLALFNREQNAAVVGLVLVGSVLAGQRRQASGVAAAAGLWVVWVAILRITYGTWPFLPSGGNFAPPFGGLADGFRHLSTTPYPRRMSLLLWGSLLHTVLLLAAAGWCALRVQSRGLAVFILGGVVLALLGGHNLYIDLYSYRRVLVWHTLGVWFHGVQTGNRWAGTLLASAGVWSVAPALGYV
jgi:hypothetical protein